MSRGRQLTSGGQRLSLVTLTLLSVVAAAAGLGQLSSPARGAAHEELISATPSGAPANGVSIEPRVSADGRFVWFTSRASDLVPSVPADNNLRVYIRDVAARATTLAGAGVLYAVSSNGRFGLIARTANHTSRFDRVTGEDVTFIEPGSGPNDPQAVSDDGNIIAFRNQLYRASDDVVIPFSCPDGNAPTQEWHPSMVNPAGTKALVATSGCGGASSWFAFDINARTSTVFDCLVDEAEEGGCGLLVTRELQHQFVLTSGRGNNVWRLTLDGVRLPIPGSTAYPYPCGVTESGDRAVFLAFGDEIPGERDAESSNLHLYSYDVATGQIVRVSTARDSEKAGCVPLPHASWAVSAVDVVTYTDGTQVWLTSLPSGGSPTTTTTSSTTSTTAPPASSAIRYAALGDSFSAGEGDPPFTGESGRDIDGGGCHRADDDTDGSYPWLLRNDSRFPGSPDFLEPDDAAKRGVKPSWVACSGAVIDNVYGTGQNQEPRQAEALADSRTNLVTLSMSGNDVGLKPILVYCFATRRANKTCESTFRLYGVGGVDAVEQNIRASFPRLVELLRRIKDPFGDPATPDRTQANNPPVFVLDYPPIFPHDPSLAQQLCLEQIFTRSDIAFLREKQDHLIDMVQKAALKAGVHLVKVGPAFEDSNGNHSVCRPGDNYINYPAIGGHLEYSFHPNAKGQRAFVDRLIAATNPDGTPALVRGGKINPSPNPAPIPSCTGSTSTNCVSDLPEGRPAISLDFLPTEVIVNKGPGAAKALLKARSGLWRATSPVRFTLFSTPLDLGTATADANGAVVLSAELPESVELGGHLLIAEGTDASGLPRIVTQAVVVNEASSAGNGGGTTSGAGGSTGSSSELSASGTTGTQTHSALPRVGGGSGRFGTSGSDVIPLTATGVAAIAAGLLILGVRRLERRRDRWLTRR